jgi:hypothetical protein
MIFPGVDRLASRAAFDAMRVGLGDLRCRKTIRRVHLGGHERLGHPRRADDRRAAAKSGAKREADRWFCQSYEGRFSADHADVGCDEIDFEIEYHRTQFPAAEHLSSQIPSLNHRPRFDDALERSRPAGASIEASSVFRAELRWDLQDSSILLGSRLKSASM